MDYLNTLYDMEKYFSEWFNIIPYSEAKSLWEKGNKNFLILRKDRSDSYADNFKSWEEIEQNYPDILFGVEKKN